MKKTVFYSMVLKNGQIGAKQWQGWTDGEYNYYKYRGDWFCIEPNTGHSVGQGETRAIARTFADLNANNIAELRKKPEWLKITAQFSAAIEHYNKCIA